MGGGGVYIFLCCQQSKTKYNTILYTIYNHTEKILIDKQLNLPATLALSECLIKSGTLNAMLGSADSKIQKENEKVNIYLGDNDIPLHSHKFHTLEADILNSGKEF